MAIFLVVATPGMVSTASAHDASQEYEWSTTASGSYGISAPEEHRFETSDGTEIQFGLWRPVDSAGDPVQDVPVIVEAGPYYGLLDHVVTERADRMGEWLIEEFVPHGYAVAQVAVRGTGDSGGCMELQSRRSAQDLDELVTRLADQSWTNGKIGMTGKSYDGAATWMAAQFGNPSLETIVPLAGSTDLEKLHFHNGTSESRAPIFHSGVYYPFGFGFYPVGASGLPLPVVNEERSLEHRMANALCPEVVEGSVFGPLGTVAGTGQTPVTDRWWAERDFTDDALANYTGSAFVVHGLWDWNVDAHQVVPFFREVQQAGIEAKMWLGQWAHQYPDRMDGWPAEHDAVGASFAETLLDWFDRHLKGETVDTGPTAEVQERGGSTWNEYDTYPPPADRQIYKLAPDGVLQAAEPSQTSRYPLTATQSYVASQFLTPWLEGGAWYCRQAPGSVQFVTTAADQDHRFSGNVRLHATVQTVSGGNLYAELCRVEANGNVWRLAKAEMNLLYADGGEEPEPFTPGVPFEAKMQFLPQDVEMETGDRLMVNLYHNPFFDPLASPQSTHTHVLGGPGQPTELSVPVVAS